ncbi:MAG: aminomethyl transferase family protein [Fretibacterium sp.]|nr:aminomethyl transferase family protein [Fretibacterium sp.]
MLKRTPLIEPHRKLGGELTDFGGWEMPLWYNKTGAVKEHLFVLEKSGLFDICHMCLVRVTGENACDLLQHCLTRNVEKLAYGACGYTMILNEQAYVVDDCIVYNMGENDYLLVVNSGRGKIVADHLKAHNTFAKVNVNDEQDLFGKVDLQGPTSVDIVRRLLAKGKGKDSLSGLKYFRFLGDYTDKNSDILLPGNIPVLLSRTGYTGEVGFEIIVPYDKTLETWNMILEEGGDDVTPCGLACRDSLRVGAVLPLSQQDVGPWPFINTPWDFTIPRKDGKLTKKFIGSTVYDNPPSSYVLPFCGFDPRKVDAHANAEVLLDGTKIGVVSTCVNEPAIGRVDGVIYGLASPDKPANFKPRGLSCGYVRVDRALSVGSKVTLKDERRSIEVEIVSDIRPGRTSRIPI